MNKDGGDPVGFLEACRRVYFERIFIYRKVRASRSEYWFGYLGSVAVGFVLSLLELSFVGFENLAGSGFAEHYPDGEGGVILSGGQLFFVLVWVVVAAWLYLGWISSLVRRIRDGGFSPYFALLLLVPVLGWEFVSLGWLILATVLVMVFLIVLCVLPSAERGSSSAGSPGA